MLNMRVMCFQIIELFMMGRSLSMSKPEVGNQTKKSKALALEIVSQKYNAYALVKIIAQEL